MLFIPALMPSIHHSMQWGELGCRKSHAICRESEVLVSCNKGMMVPGTIAAYGSVIFCLSRKFLSRKNPAWRSPLSPGSLENLIVETQGNQGFHKRNIISLRFGLQSVPKDPFFMKTLFLPPAENEKYLWKLFLEKEFRSVKNNLFLLAAKNGEW